VRDARRQRAEGGQLLGLMERRALPLELRRDTLALGDVR
jgi:hypothetical protein